MKIAIISHSFPPQGGGGITAANWHLFNALRATDAEVRVFTVGDSGPYREDPEGHVVRSGVPRVVAWLLRKSFRVLFRILDRGKLAYQTLDIALGVLGALRVAPAVRRWGPDVIISPDQGLPALGLRKGDAVLVLGTHHNPMRFLNNPLIGEHSERDARWALALENRLLEKTDKVICPSEYMKDVFENTHTRRPQIKVIPNFVDLSAIDDIDAEDVRAALDLPGDASVVYIPSAGSAIKGERFVFEIIRRLSHGGRPIGFYLSGALPPDLQYTLKFLPGNARILAPGHVDYRTNLSYVKGCSFAVSPCLLESFGMAIVEANLCGVPAVAFDVGGNSGLVENGVNGYICAYLDLEDLVEKASLLTDDTHCAVLKANARAHIKKTLNQENNAQELLTFLAAGK